MTGRLHADPEPRITGTMLLTAYSRFAPVDLSTVGERTLMMRFTSLRRSICTTVSIVLISGFCSILESQAGANFTISFNPKWSAPWTGKYLLRPTVRMFSADSWARAQPGYQHAATFQIREGREYEAKSRYSDESGVLWYELVDGTLTGYVAATAIRSRASSDEYERIIDYSTTLKELVGKSRSESKGRLAKHAGLYRIGKTCDGDFSREMPWTYTSTTLLLSFRGSQMSFQQLDGVSKEQVHVLIPSRTIRAENDGSMQWYKFGEEEFWFGNDELRLTPTFSKTSFTYRAAKRCSNEGHIITQLQSALRSTADSMRTERPFHSPSNPQKPAGATGCEALDQRLQATIIKELRIDPVMYSDEVDIGAGLGADHNDQDRLLFAVDEEFDTHLYPDSMRSFRTAGELKQLINSQLNCKDSSVGRSSPGQTQTRPDPARTKAIADRVMAIVANSYKVKLSAVRLDSEIQKEFSKDDIDYMEFMLNIFEEFKIDIPPRIVFKFKTVGDIVQYLVLHQSNSR